MIEARAITKRFGAFTAVDDVSLRVEAGEFLTLLGPSGCGKTTLLRVLAGFESPDTGSVWLDGRDVTPLPPYRRNLNQVFQSYALFPHLSVRANVAFGLRMQGVPPAEQAARVAEAIGVVALSGLEERKPDQLSGGQRQRVALARAIVCRPKVLLLDEPLSALDAKLRRGMQFELKQLQRRLGITFIFVTHDQQEALTMSDRVAVMNRGRIEQLAPPEELYRRPRTAFAADFIGQANLIPVTVTGREGNQLTVRSAEGLEARLPAGALAPGRTAALLSVRPENILLGEEPFPAAACRFIARVDAKLFQGPTDRLAITTEHGVRLQVTVTGDRAVKRALAPGDRIHAGIHDDDLVVLDGDER